MMRRLLLLLCYLLPLSASAIEVQVEILGLDDPLRANVSAFLSLQRAQGQKGLTPERVHLLHRQAPQEIRQALQPFGYFKPVIEPSLEKTAQGLLARYRVDPGPPIRLAQVDFQVQGPGSQDPLFAKGFPLKAGAVLDQPAYEQAKQDLLSRALEQGYLNAHYSLHQLEVDLDSYQARIRLHLDTGVHFRFGEVRFLQDQLDPDFLVRYLRFRPGDPFRQDKLLTLQANLIDSEYFSQVEVHTRRDQAQDDLVPVDLTLTPNAPNRYRAGIGFATDTGPRLTFDWTRRRIGREGSRMTTELRLSAPNSLFKTEYLIPLERPWQDSLSFSLGAENFDTDTHKGSRLALSSAHSVGLQHDWRRTLGLDYSYEDFEVGEETGTAHHLIPSVVWSRLRQKGRDFDTQGQRLNFQLQGAAEPLLSSSSFLQGHATERFIYGLGTDWRLLARSELGATYAASLSDLPASRRFFAGGDNSVRGYTLDQLGPKDDTGKVIGGRFLAVGSLEVERRILGKWSAALFYDLGNAFDPDYDNKLAYGAGFGVRWRSPVGPVRVDLASALSIDGNPWRLHIVVGPEL
jgi:translocation and assembly module TamA